MVIFYVVHLAILPLLFALPLPGRSFFLTKGVFSLCLISFLPADYPQVLPYKKPPHPFPDAAACRSLIKFYQIPASDCRNIDHNAEICLSCPHSGLPAKSPGQPASALRRVFLLAALAAAAVAAAVVPVFVPVFMVGADNVGVVLQRTA